MGLSNEITYHSITFINHKSQISNDLFYKLRIQDNDSQIRSLQSQPNFEKYKLQ